MDTAGCGAPRRGSIGKQGRQQRANPPAYSIRLLVCLFKESTRALIQIKMDSWTIDGDGSITYGGPYTDY
jgi:hypothetical protein